MAYIGQGLDRFSNVEKLDVITPSTATGAGPYNLTKDSVAFIPSSADTMVVSINGVVQYGNFTVNSSTITFSGALTDSDTCDFMYHMGTGLLSTPVDGSVSTGQLADGGITPIKFSTSGISAGNVIKVNDAGTAWELGAASSAEIYGFSKDSNGDLIVTTTNQGQDDISSATYATFDDVLYSASGFTFSLNSNGELIATI
jgi:hypothetical protein